MPRSRCVKGRNPGDCGKDRGEVKRPNRRTSARRPTRSEIDAGRKDKKHGKDDTAHRKNGDGFLIMLIKHLAKVLPCACVMAMLEGAS